MPRDQAVQAAASLVFRRVGNEELKEVTQFVFIFTRGKEPPFSCCLIKVTQVGFINIQVCWGVTGRGAASTGPRGAQHREQDRRTTAAAAATPSPPLAPTATAHGLT